MTTALNHPFRKFVTLLMAALVLVSVFTIPVSAKNVCTEIQGSGKIAKTFQVETGSRWLWFKDKITIKQTKGTYTINIAPDPGADVRMGRLLKGVFYGWTKYPTWRVTKTKGILSCN